jgi:hypothetical protein
MIEEAIEVEKYRRVEEVAWAIVKALNQPRTEWDIERDGLRNTQIARYFI